MVALLTFGVSTKSLRGQIWIFYPVFCYRTHHYLARRTSPQCSCEWSRCIGATARTGSAPVSCPPKANILLPVIWYPWYGGGWNMAGGRALAPIGLYNG
ncbi:hypothetical protein BgiMline_029041, partial [Biomphalaria glabrata]